MLMSVELCGQEVMERVTYQGHDIARLDASGC